MPVAKLQDECKFAKLGHLPTRNEGNVITIERPLLPLVVMHGGLRVAMAAVETEITKASSMSFNEGAKDRGHRYL